MSRGQASEAAELLARAKEYDVVLFPWELAERAPLRDRLPSVLAGARRILVIVGPEGGFSHAEAQAAHLTATAASTRAGEHPHQGKR